MMAHSQPPEVLAKQARIMADAGCQCVYVVDSAGALIMEDVSDRVAALVAELGDDAQVGFHGHENLRSASPTRCSPIRAGAMQIDGCTRALRCRRRQHADRGAGRRLRASSASAPASTSSD